MRIDHIAYQRATRVAGIGFALQFIIGLTLLLIGLLVPDTTFAFASVYAFVGIFVWLALVIVFNQHKLERLEALESDELQQQRLAGLGSAFDEEATGEFNVAGRRLQIMHKWLMPLVSWMVILALAGFGFWGLSRLGATYLEGGEFHIVGAEFRGWALAACIAIAAGSFVFSRFVAGMARQEAWQNLRGGAGYMVGNALVMLAMAVGIIFTYFDNMAVLQWVARAVLIFMIIYAAETLLNFILNLYRPRRAGEIPRPAFDSRLLSLLSAPDSIIRSINEAVNYQFGFDITSSWGYQLMLRAARSLALFAIVVLLLLNCMFIVEPHQQAVRLRGGEIAGVETSGLHLKWPWPFEEAQVYNVTRVRELPLTARLRQSGEQCNDPVLWSQEIDRNLGIEPFIVSTSSARIERPAEADEELAVEEALEAVLQQEPDEEEQVAADIASRFALIDAEFVLHYRIKPDGLENFLRFTNSAIERRQTLDNRERALRAVALREVTKYLSATDLDRIIAQDRAQMVADLRQRIQEQFDAYKTGVEVLTVSNPWIRPSGTAATKFERLAFNIAGAEQEKAEAESFRVRQLTAAAGSPTMALRMIREIERYETMAQEGASEEELAAQNDRIEDLFLSAGGQAARTIAEARADLWLRVLGAEGRLEEFKGRLAAFKAAPEIYSEWLLMEVLAGQLPDVPKYFLGADPARFILDIEVLQPEEGFVMEEGLAQPDETTNGGSSQ